MDFKYIEQLLERYFAAETTAEEEQILRTFFRQDEMPAHLRRWQPLFRAQDRLSQAHLDEQFDERLLAMTGERHVQAIRIPLRQRLRPLYTAAAFVAFAVVIGTAVEHSASDGSNPQPAAVATVQDELDPAETTPLDIRSAEAVETLPKSAVADSLDKIN